MNLIPLIISAGLITASVLVSPWFLVGLAGYLGFVVLVAALDA